MQTGSSNEKKLSESDEDNDAAEEEKRAHEQRWDDYKDSEWFIVFSCWLSSRTERMLMVLLLQTVDSIRIAVVLRGCRSMGQGSAMK
uniref:Uncharacterized protein n=1 Tax=Parascaris equorum TaxID=6256 RepID=A0A914S774_PAREQ